MLKTIKRYQDKDKDRYKKRLMNRKEPKTQKTPQKFSLKLHGDK